MRIDKLTLKNFRGYKETQKFEIGGEHALISGGNGAGKSSALEAIEFILTGKIDRLHGSGTQGIRAKEHLPHRDASPRDVQASVGFQTGNDIKVTASRRFTDQTVDINPTSPPAEFNDVKRLVEHGLHKLTRSDMIELVVSTPTDRGSLIDELLNLEGVDNRRKQLRRLRNQHYISNIKRIQRSIEEQEELLRETLEISEVEDSKLRDAVNRARATLGGDAIDSLGDWESLDFRRDLAGPEAQEISAFQREDVKNQLRRQGKWFDQTETDLISELEELETARRELAAQEARVNTDVLSVLERGQGVIDNETDACPLCGTNWDSEELIAVVERRQQQFEEIADQRQSLHSTGESVLSTIQSYLSRSEVLLAVLGGEIDVGEDESLRAYMNALGEIQKVVEMIRQEESQEVPDLRELTGELPSERASRASEQLRSKVEDQPAKSEMERAWEVLSTAESRLSQIAKLQSELEVKQGAKKVCTAARDELVQARTEVLEDRYSSVESTFKKYYESTNPDEADVNVQMEQTNAGVKFRIGFFDDELHPPHAMHSEGHQDMMGICLFLALSKELSEHQDRFVLLDDVVMSIDGDHREEIAKLFQGTISDEFQFIITTHDEIWEEQLRRLGVIPLENQYRVDWSRENGTVVRN
ncbi:SMC domain-containing protein [Natrialba hulunbeirensis JCM 10989]|uniref:SMC domain-containing protein n=1 Tax=Natrialba hulunbeirensis JCM 10989 TaxID=1227493 RepID=M0AE90_9EURY|nr:AAA family ATPase [Natrialba hulunbeirensis]ELY96192.1 SMC domain-containing protein [Natrialba hulunbeirensis JCM 10989]